jgi:hypothetical protein
MPSMINKEKGMIFLHLSKTGGTTVSKILKNHGFVNIDLSINGGHIGYREDFKEYFTFGFIRHPERWYKSLYRFFKGLDWMVGVADFTRYKSDNINDFIDKVIENNQYIMGGLVSEFFNEDVSFIGKMENLMEDLDRVLSMHNINMTHDERNIKINVSKKYPDEINQEHKDWIRETCSEIYDRFSYDYD